jgi:hypothetical protein
MHNESRRVKVRLGWAKTALLLRFVKGVALQHGLSILHKRVHLLSEGSHITISDLLSNAAHLHKLAEGRNEGLCNGEREDELGCHNQELRREQSTVSRAQRQ